jgi:exonuclease V gamma subunit
MALSYMSEDDVADMLDANELSERFEQDEDDLELEEQD